MKPAAAPALQASRPAVPRGPSATGMHKAAAPALRPGHIPNQEGVKDGQFRTNEGKIVDLPDDLTAYDAACLEAEATAAKQRLGRGPPPKPVPDVKAKIPKPEPKELPRPAGSKKKGARPSGAAPSVGAAGALLAKAGTSPVARYLANKGAPALARGMGRLANLKANETTHDNAGQKLAQSEAAVIIPRSEEQSKSNDAQVGVVGARPAPEADERRGKAALAQALAENAPRTIEDVDDFKSNQKAQHTGAEVLRVVQTDSTAVLGTFGDLKKTPPPTPTDHVTEALPPPEVAPGTAPMLLGQGAIAPLQKEHTDTRQYTQEVDSKLVEEGITQEQLDMVDSGDLAEANKEKKGMATTAASEPLAIQRFALQEAQSVNASLQHQEKAGRSRMQARRKQGLGQTGKKQSKTQLDLQKKREEVASEINGIYQAAQDLVKKRLTDLETTSARRFDEGNARAIRTFEDNVNREIDAFKDDRYSGWTGPYYRVRDWVKGIDELPEVEAIFIRNKETFVREIEALVAEISADQKRVIAECKAELAKAKTKIKEYVDSLGPALKDIGKQAADEMNNKLAELDEYIKGQEEELKAQLKDKQTAAIRAIDQKIEKMKESMSGLVGKLKRLLLWAAKKFFAWALGKFGVSLETIENVIDKGAAVLKAIFTKPIRFFVNLIRAAGQGFQSFGKNFPTHLKNAVFTWLGGALEDIEPPKSWDLKGILDLTFRMLGFTAATLHEEITKLLPPSAVDALKTTFDLVQRIRAEGLSAVWVQLQEVAGDLKETLREAVQNWLATTVIKRAILEILKLFAPAGGLVAAVIGIYKTVVFFIKRAGEIKRMIGSFLDSIAEIAAGNVTAAADALEGGLARGIQLVISFLTGYVGLEGITGQIRTVVERMRDRVRGMLAKVARWVVEMAKKAGKLALQAGVPQDPNERLNAAARAAVILARTFQGIPAVDAVRNLLVKGLKTRYGLTDLEVSQSDGTWYVHLHINPRKKQELKGLGNAKGEDNDKVGPLHLKTTNRKGQTVIRELGRVPFKSKTKKDLAIEDEKRMQRGIAEGRDALELRYADWRGSLNKAMDAVEGKHGLPTQASERDNWNAFRRSLRKASARSIRSTAEELLTGRSVQTTTIAAMLRVEGVANKSTGKLADEAAGAWGRRHIISHHDLATYYNRVVPPMLLKDAAKALGEAPHRQSIIRAVHEKHAEFFNRVDNLWVGGQRENASFGEVVDPPPDWTREDLKRHIRKITADFAIKGHPFIPTFEEVQG